MLFVHIYARINTWRSAFSHNTGTDLKIMWKHILSISQHINIHEINWNCRAIATISYGRILLSVKPDVREFN